MIVLVVDTVGYFGHRLSQIHNGDAEKLLAKIGCLFWSEFCLYVYTAGDTKSCQLHICTCIFERFGNALSCKP